MLPPDRVEGDCVTPGAGAGHQGVHMTEGMAEE